MFLRVKVEEKIRHYTLSSREWNNVLYVKPSREDPPLGLVDRQSRLSLGSTDTLHVCSWRLDRSRWIRPRGCDSNWVMLGIRSGDWTNIPKSSGNHIAWGRCGAMMISSHLSRWTVSSTRGNWAGGGYAYTYAHSAFQLIDRASTPIADGSRTGDTNSGSLWFHLVANRSSKGIPHCRVSAQKTDGCKDHSVPDIWAGCNARTFNFLGLCRAWSTIWMAWHMISSLLFRLHSCIDRFPPCLLMWDTTVELSDATRTARPKSFRSQWSMALCMASKSSMLMWSVFSVVVHTPDTVNAFQCAPQPMFKASVNNWVSGSVGVTGTTLRTL